MKGSGPILLGAIAGMGTGLLVHKLLGPRAPEFTIIAQPPECARQDAPFLCGLDEAINNTVVNWLFLPSVAGGLIGYVYQRSK